MDTAQWTQDFGVAKSMAENISAAPMNNSCTRSSSPCPSATERKMRPPKTDQAVNCPRCNSTNTKFCYYNNYSLTQPRYFCKTCRRYWTEGGTLRNVPVGGGSRKNKKSINIITSATSSSSHNKLMQLPAADLKYHNSQFPSSHDHQNPKIYDQGHDLNLNDYNHGMNITQFIEFPKNDHSSTANAKDHHHMMNMINIPTCSSNSNHQISALDFLRINGGMNFPFQECKPSDLGFSHPNININVGHHQDQSSTVYNGSSCSLMFTLGATKRSTDQLEDHDQNHEAGNKGQADDQINSNGFWNGMLGGGNNW